MNQVCLGCANTEAEADHHAVQAREDLLRIITATDGTDEKQNPNTCIFQPITAWTYDMGGHDEKCVEKYCDLWEKSVSALKPSELSRMDDHRFHLQILTVQVNWDPMCVQIVLDACTWPELEDLIYVGQRPCDKRLAR